MRVNQPGVFIQPQNLSSNIMHQLKEGQKIVAKIISVTDNEVLLQVGGDQIRAKVEGNLPTAGSVFVFGIQKTDGQRIELKTLANLSEGRMMEGLFPEEHLLANALKEQRLPVNKEKLDAFNRLLSEIQLKLQLNPNPKVAALMLFRGLPPSLGGYIIAWLHQDKKLRENLWNKLNEMGLVDRRAVFEPKGDAEELMQALWRLWKDSQRASETNGFAKAAGLLQDNRHAADDIQLEAEAMLEETAREPKDKWKIIADLLSHPATWSEKGSSGDAARAVNYGAFPFLVQLAGDKIRECVVHWEEEQQVDKSMTEQLIRVVVPTENLGEIVFTVIFCPRRSPRIRFQVESEEIQQLLSDQTETLRKIIGGQVRVEIETVKVKKDVSEGVDLWI